MHGWVVKDFTDETLGNLLMEGNAIASKTIQAFKR
jgi:hypothetical protein